MSLRDKLSKAVKKLPKMKANDLVPEWADDLEGEPLFLRGLSGEERDDYESSRIIYRFDRNGTAEREMNLKNLRARLLVKCLVDAEGQRVFDDSGAAILGKGDGAVLDRLFEKAIELSGMDRDAEERLEKNLRKAAGDGSSAGSPGISNGATCNGALHESAAPS